MASRCDRPTAVVVEDDPDVREWILRLLASHDIAGRGLENAARLLALPDLAEPDCCILDCCLPGMSGLALFDELRHRGWRVPTIVITGYGDVDRALQFMHRGAVDFLEKPFSAERFLERVEQALGADADLRCRRAGRQLRLDLATLTPRERVVMRLMLQGRLSKQIARDLGISERTVESHRSRVMLKLGVKSLAQLARLDAADAWCNSSDHRAARFGHRSE